MFCIYKTGKSGIESIIVHHNHSYPCNKIKYFPIIGERKRTKQPLANLSITANTFYTFGKTRCRKKCSSELRFYTVDD